MPDVDPLLEQALRSEGRQQRILAALPWQRMPAYDGGRAVCAGGAGCRGSLLRGLGGLVLAGAGGIDGML